MRKRLGQVLLEAGAIDEAALRTALADQRRWGRPLGKTLVELNFVAEDVLVRLLAGHLGLPTVNLDKLDVADGVLARVSPETALRHRVVPFAITAHALDVGLFEAATLSFTDELAFESGLRVRPFLAGPRMIDRALHRFYGGPAHDELVIDVGPTVTQQDEIGALQVRISQLEALVERDEQVLRKVLALLVESGVATREQLLARLA